MERYNTLEKSKGNKYIALTLGLYFIFVLFTSINTWAAIFILFSGIFAFTMLRAFTLYSIIALLALITPFQIYTNIGTSPIAIGYIIITITIILFILMNIQGKETIKVNKTGTLLFIFIISLAVSSINALSLFSLTIKIIQIIQYFLLYILITNTINNIYQVKKITNIIIVVSTISGIIGIGQWVFATFVDSSAVINFFFDRWGLVIFGARGVERIASVQGEGFFFRAELAGIGRAFRAFGMFGGGNAFGFYQALIFPFALFILSKKKDWPFFYRISILLTIGISVFLSWSRMAWIMIAFSIILFISSYFIKYPTSILKMIIMSFMILLLFTISIIPLLFLFPDFPIFQAILATVTRSDASTISRLASMQKGLSIFLQHPFIGGGFGNYPSLLLGTTVENATSYTAENLYIELLAELGLVGFTSFFLVMRSIWQDSYNLARQGRSAFSRSFGQATCSVWIVSIIGFAFNAGFVEPRTMIMWWMLFGLVAVSFRIEQQQFEIN